MVNITDKNEIIDSKNDVIIKNKLDVISKKFKQPVEYFQYINKNIEHIGKSIKEKYSIDELKSKMIIRDCQTNSYYVIDSKNCLKFIESTEESSRTFHEIIFGFQNQKLKFDIDIKNSDLVDFIPDKLMTTFDNVEFDLIEDKELNSTKSMNILETIKQKIKETLLILYFKDDVELIITDSSGLDLSTNQQKYSFHIIVDNYYVANNKESQNFMRELIKVLPIKYSKFIDINVNKDIQSFRLIDCHKFESNRVKRLMTKYKLKRDEKLFKSKTIITNVDGCEKLESLGDINTPKPNLANAKYTQKEIDEVLLLAKDIVSGFTFHFQKNNLFIFKRVHPSYCQLCSEIHHNDNTLMLMTNEKVIKNNFSMDSTQITDAAQITIISVYLLCRHLKGKSLFVGDIYRGKNFDGTDVNHSDVKHICALNNELANNKDWKEIRLSKIIDDSLMTVREDGINMKTLFDVLPDNQKNVYSEPKLRKFEIVNTLVVRAGMKLGKSNNLKKYIDECFTNSQYNDTRIIIISFRKSWSGAVQKLFGDEFQLYSDMKGKLSSNKLIIQVESLHRLDVSNPPDLLILDECESIFEQFDSGNMKGNFNSSFAVFKYLMKFSKYIIGMDANITNRSYNLFTHFRGVENIYYHYNSFKNAGKNKYYFTTKELVWFNQLLTDVGNGKKVVIPVNTLSFAKIVYEYLSTTFKDKVIKLYCGETDQVEKVEHFKDVKKYWSQYDVLIYSSSVSAGISFEEIHYDRLFAHFTNRTCSALTAIQMCGRVRQLKDETLFICFNTCETNLPITADEIETNLRLHRQLLISDNILNETNVSYEFNMAGEIIFEKNDYFTLWMNNKISKNISMNDFEKLFIGYIADVGAQCFHLDSVVDTAVLLKIKEMKKEIKEQIIELEITCIAEAKDISHEEAEVIKSKFKQQENVSLVEIQQLKKFKLKDVYNWAKPINTDFVRNYNDSKIQYMYKNLVRINDSKYLSYEDCLNDIHLKEKLNYLNDIRDGNDNFDHNYSYTKHYIAYIFLKICGFKDTNDTKFIPFVLIHRNIKNNIGKIIKLMPQLLVEFNILKKENYFQVATNELLVKKTLAIINIVLFKMYGLKIITDANNVLYSINHIDLFNYTDEITDDKPSIKPPMVINQPVFDDDEYDESTYNQLNVDGAIDELLA